MPGFSVRDVHDLILDRITDGNYPPGSRLPTSRELAADLGVNRNTVAKAFGRLADVGLLTVQPGRGAFVVARPFERDRPTVLSRVRGQLALAIRRARGLGLAADDLHRLVREEIDSIYGNDRRRGLYVECNAEDVQAGVREVESLAGVRLDACVLHDFAGRTERVARDYDVVCTSLFHLQEVTRLVRDRLPSDTRVIGLCTQPDEGALNLIATLPLRASVGIVAADEAGARRFDSLISTVAAATTTLLVNPGVDDIRSVAPRLDAVVSSRSQADRVRSACPDLPTIVLHYLVTAQSAARVLEALCPPLAAAAD